MYFIINVDQNGMAPQRISPQVTVKGCQNCWISNPTDQTDDDVLWNGSEEDGNVRSECEEDEGTDCEDAEWQWLVKVNRIWPALCIKWMQLIVNYFS